MMVKVNLLVMAAIILFSHLWLFSVFIHAAGKGNDVRKRPSTRASGSSGDDPVLNSISQWQKQSLEVLKLACEQVHLVSSGSRSVLARRLYDHYHRPAHQQSDPILLPLCLILSIMPRYLRLLRYLRQLLQIQKVLFKMIFKTFFARNFKSI